MSKPIQVFVAHGDGGEWGAGPAIGFFTSRERAVEAAKGQGYFGSNGHVSTAHVVVAGENYWLLGKLAPVCVDGRRP